MGKSSCLSIVTLDYGSVQFALNSHYNKRRTYVFLPNMFSPRIEVSGVSLWLLFGVMSLSCFTSCLKLCSAAVDCLRAASQTILASLLQRALQVINVDSTSVIKPESRQNKKKK